VVYLQCGGKKKVIYDCSIFLGKISLSSESRDRKEVFLFVCCVLFGTGRNGLSVERQWGQA
jgi:hypothetical protein